MRENHQVFRRVQVRKILEDSTRKTEAPITSSADRRARQGGGFSSAPLGKIKDAHRREPHTAARRIISDPRPREAALVELEHLRVALLEELRVIGLVLPPRR